MKPRCLRSAVDRLPTIKETQESDAEDGDSAFCLHNMEQYVDSIKELSHPAPYPLHGPLRGHRRWIARRPTPAAPARLFHSSGTSPPWTPVDLSDILLTFCDLSNCHTSLRFKQNLQDMLAAESLLAGLV